MKPPPVIIIGAGAAGLAAAHVLNANGCPVLILEARNRLGGRIDTRRAADSKMPLELGAEFIHGRPKVTMDLVAQAGLITCEVPFEHKSARRGGLVNLPHYFKTLSTVMKGLAHLSGPDISFAEYLRRHGHGRTNALSRRLAVDFVEGFDAADTERISARSIAQEQLDLGNLESEPQYRLLSGYGGVIEHLRHSLDPALTTIKLRHIVSQILWRKAHVEICCSNTTDIFVAPRLLITLPLGVLQLPPETPGSVRFIPEIAAKRCAVTLLGSGPVIKILIQLRSPLSPPLRDASFLHLRAAFPTWWTTRPLATSLLTGWVGGPKALAMSGSGVQHIRTAALESLALLLNCNRSSAERLVASFHTHDWPADPFARGAYSYVLPGGHSARQILRKPAANTLFFAGEATDTSGQASTVAGALLSGHRAACEILATM